MLASISSDEVKDTDQQEKPQKHTGALELLLPHSWYISTEITGLARFRYNDALPCLQVTIGSIAAALLGFAGTDAKKEHQPTENLVEIIAMILLPVAVAMVAYALVVFIWRSKAIAKKQARCFPGSAANTFESPFRMETAEGVVYPEARGKAMPLP